MEGNKRERFRHQAGCSCMEKDGKRHVFLIFILMVLSCLCWGCGDTRKEVSADYTAQGVPENNEAEMHEAEADDVGIADYDIDSASAQGDGDGNDEAEEADSEDGKPEADSESAGERREPVKVRGIYVSGPVAGIARMDELIDLVDQTELNAMVIDIKNDDGKVTYDMQSDQVLEIEAGVGYIPDIEALVSKCKEKDIYLIARIVAFRDPYLAEKKPEWAVHTKDGGIFRDKSGLAWVNPYQREVWDYLVEIAGEAAAAGFDEVQFDYIRFSTDIKADEVDYGPESESVGKVEIITEFTEYLYEQLAPLGVYVAADVFGTVIDSETDQAIVGQDYVKMAEHLDYICPMVYPSHYSNGSYGIAVPDAEPYRTIYGACSASVQELSVLPEENRAHVRAWLQCFTASWVSGHISYGPQQIRAQIKGAYDAGYEEWILWNAAVKYQRDSLLTEEEAEAERLQWEAEKQEVKEQGAVIKEEEKKQDAWQSVEPDKEEQTESGQLQQQSSENAETEQPLEPSGELKPVDNVELIETETTEQPPEQPGGTQ